jgi:hypothetical protein
VRENTRKHVRTLKLQNAKDKAITFEIHIIFFLLVTPVVRRKQSPWDTKENRWEENKDFAASDP